MAYPLTILLVDDKVIILHVTKQMLEAYGYHVLIASTPSEAVQVAANYQGDIHLLLTDVMMPGMNGVELSKQLSLVRKNMHTLFMSAFPDELLAQAGVDVAANNLIQKPFTMEELIRKVRSVSNRDSSKARRVCAG